MKEKYIKNKKLIKSFLSIGTTLIVIAFFSFFAGKKYYLLGAVSLIIGLLFIAFTYLLNNSNKKMIKVMMVQCPICNKKVNCESKINYYINGKLIEEDDYNNCSFNYQKEQIVFEFYKCLECAYCLTVIKTYIVKNDKKALKSTKYNVDFNYSGDY